MTPYRYRQRAVKDQATAAACSRAQREYLFSYLNESDSDLRQTYPEHAKVWQELSRSYHASARANMERGKPKVKQEKQSKDDQFAMIYRQAYDLAMRVASEANVSDAMCGFGWVRFPANTAWGKWCKRNKLANPSYPSGLQIWCTEFGQSWQRKRVWAEAFAEYLNAYGITCHAEDRID